MQRVVHQTCTILGRKTLVFLMERLGEREHIDAHGELVPEFPSENTKSHKHSNLLYKIVQYLPITHKYPFVSSISYLIHYKTVKATVLFREEKTSSEILCMFSADWTVHAFLMHDCLNVHIGRTCEHRGSIILTCNPSTQEAEVRGSQV